MASVSYRAVVLMTIVKAACSVRTDFEGLWHDLYGRHLAMGKRTVIDAYLASIVLRSARPKGPWDMP